MRVGASAGGIKAKALIDYNPNTYEIRSGFNEAKEGFIPCLIKFDGVTDGEIAGHTHFYQNKIISQSFHD